MDGIRTRLQRIRDTFDSSSLSPFPTQPLSSKLTTQEWKDIKDNAAFEGMAGGTAGAVLSSYVGKMIRLSRRAQSYAFFISLPVLSYTITQTAFGNRWKFAEKKKLEMIESDLDRMEGGARGTGMEEMKDPYASTRGDH